MKQRAQKAFLFGGCVLFFEGVFHRTIYFVRHYRTMSKYMSSPPESIASSATQFGSMYPSTHCPPSTTNPLQEAKSCLVARRIRHLWEQIKLSGKDVQFKPKQILVLLPVHFLTREIHPEMELPHLLLLLQTLLWLRRRLCTSSWGYLVNWI